MATADPDQLERADLERLGELHVACIDDSLPAQLGARFVGRMYGFLARSPSEDVLVERVDGRVESAIVLSDSPEDLQVRVALGTWRHFIPAAVVALLTRLAFWRFALGAVRDALSSDPGEHHAPEITFVFTNPQLQGKRLGKCLIERADARMRARGIATYFVKTIDDPENRAIAFYEREGFTRIGVREEAGRRFVEFHKTLDQR